MVDEPLDSFSEACGQIGPLRVHLEGAGLRNPGPIEVRRPFLVVGRALIADVTIDSPEVSRRHAYFQVVAGRIFCVDLSSRTGVRWEDGARPMGWVDRDRGVDIGPIRVRFQKAPRRGRKAEGGQLPLSRSFGWAGLTEARLEFLEGETGRQSWRVSRSLVLLGRSPTCRLKLPGPGVGKIHAALLRTPAGVWAIDLLETGGIMVKGEPTRCARLEDGDVIGLGGHRIRVRLGRAERPSARSNLARMPGTRVARPVPCRTAGLAGLDEAGRSRLELPGGLDPTTVRLLDEFNRMHQGTTEQFQQAILMMFRMHQDQMGVLRDALSRLDRLEDEQKSLRAELARLHPPQPPRLALRLVSGETSSPRLEGPGPRSVPPGPLDSPGGRSPIEPDRDARDPLEKSPPSPPPDPDSHLRIARRIAEISSERQGLWQRLLASLSGEGPDRGVL